MKLQVVKKERMFLFDTEIVLGSQSPRRQELLKGMGLDFEVVVKAVDESFAIEMPADEAVEQIAIRKVDAFTDSIYFDKLIITADTVVVCQGDLYGKPKDFDEALTMLTTLGGNTHKVLTAVAMAYKGRRYSFVEESLVEFFPLSKEEILYYIKNYEPYDKAGAYGIQEWIGAIAVKSIKGSYESVIGLPTARLYQEMKNIFQPIGGMV